MTDPQLALLSNIAYLGRPTTWSNPPKSPDNTLQGLIDYHKSRGVDLNKYGTTFEAIEANSSLKNLQVMDIVNSKCGMSAYCFKTSGGEAVYAFRGTDNWDVPGNDVKNNLHTIFGNGLGPTAQQDSALKFVQNMNNKHGFTSSYATGHSLGGNLAQYVTLYDNTVRRCAVFNSLGFSPDFRITRMGRINRNKHKITSYTSTNDPVQRLPLNKNLGKREVLKCKTHDMNKIVDAFDKSGAYGKPVEPKPTYNPPLQPYPPGGPPLTPRGAGGAGGTAGAAGVGFTAAAGAGFGAIGMRKISISIPEFQSRLASFRDHRRTLDRFLKNLDTTMRMIATVSWVNPASQLLLAKFRGLYKTVETSLKIVDKYIFDLEEAIRLYTEAENRAKGRVQVLKTDVFGI